MELASLAVGAAVGGQDGAVTALYGEQFNRQLHPDEEKIIGRLVEEGYSEEEVRAVACALVQCLSGRGLVEPGTLADGLNGNFTLTPQGQQLAAQYQQVLGGMSATEMADITNRLKQTGQFRYTAADGWKDARIDVNFGGRLDGLGQGTLGALGAWASSGLCAFTGWGCAATAESTDNLTAGLAAFYTGRPTLTLQNQAWQAAGLSPEQANIAESLTSLGLGAGAAAATNRIADSAKAAINSQEPKKTPIASAAADSEAGTSVTFHPTKPIPLGRGTTGRNEPTNLGEKLALEEAINRPEAGRVLPIPMTDRRWPSSEGWVKMSQNIGGVEIHYVRNTRTGEIDDFKFKGGVR